MVKNFVVTHAVAAAALLEQIRGVGHAFHAAGNHHIAAARDELVVREDGGFHACATHFGQGDSARALGQAALEAGLTCRRLTLACHQAVAKQHFFDLLRLDACALNGCLDRCTAQIVGCQIGKIALKRAHGRAGCTDDDDGILMHGLSPSNMHRGRSLLNEARG